MARDRKPKVSDVYSNAPVKLGGELDLDTGKEFFVQLDQHDKLIDRVKIFSTTPVVIWVLHGQSGLGKTWTLSWLSRKIRNGDLNEKNRKWEVALVPALEINA